MSSTTPGPVPGRRWTIGALLGAGIKHVLVAGEMVMEDGKMTGRLPGRVLG